MPRGKPGEGPYAGRGRQHQQTRDPKTKQTYNNHYYSYSKQNHMDDRDEDRDSTRKSAHEDED